MTKFALLATVIFSVVSAGIASAADLPPRPAPLPAPIARAPVFVEPAFTWTGCYIGAHGGYAWGQTKHTNNTNGSSGHDDLNGGLAGGQLGCNYQTGAFVIGLEGDASWASLSGSGPRADISSAPLAQPGVVHSKIDALGTIAARLGFAIDRTLLYIKGGGAFAVEKHWATLDLTGETLFTTDRYTRWGWMAGAGIEYAFTPNWSVKAEYNYMDLGKKSPEFCTAATGANCNAPTSISQNLHVVKAGVNFRFGGR
jgi:outer membrane immunogenic protein